jgi:truncated hemoglobin YjbI
MAKRAALLDSLGGEAGCMQLSETFYARVAKDPVLRRLFPGKTLTCAIEEFAAFLIQFFGGDENQTQRRWWVSLHESHARFQISAAERSAWLKNMRAALDAAPVDAATRDTLWEYFTHSSGYVVDTEAPAPKHAEVVARWREQLKLDGVVAAITAERDAEAIAAAPRFAARPVVYVGLLARMLRTGRPALVGHVTDAVANDATLITRRFAGQTMLHYAANDGCMEVVRVLLTLGADPNVHDDGGHTPLYRVANGCASEAGPRIVLALADAGADVNAATGVNRTTALHMAARRGHVDVARALIACGAKIDARDRKGETPLQRARNCRRPAVAQLLIENGAAPQP